MMTATIALLGSMPSMPLFWSFSQALVLVLVIAWGALLCRYFDRRRP